MTLLPESIPFRAAFLGVFAVIVETRYSIIERAHEDPENEEEHDPDEVRSDLANAISDTASALGLSEPHDDTAAEWHGELSDIVTEAWEGLAAFLTNTTDQSET